MLVVDGSDVCRAPIVAFLLGERLAGALSGVDLVTRGLEAEAGRTMCESASARLGYSGPAIAHYGAHRATPLTVEDIAAADLVLTAERAQRSAVVRMLPGTQSIVFTWKEALVLADVLLHRHRASAVPVPDDLPTVARFLHGARGTVPLVEPPVRTGPFHFRRVAEGDPLTVPSGHDGTAEHRRVTEEAVAVASGLGARLAALAQEGLPVGSADRAPSRRLFRRTA